MAQRSASRPLTSYRNEPRCIICGKPRDGLEVQDDPVLRSMRWFKRNISRNEQGYRLIVCKSCYPIYSKNRVKFTNREVLYVGLGVVLSLLLIISGGNKALAVLYSVGIILFMYALSLLTYMPALKVKPPEERAASRRLPAR